MQEPGTGFPGRRELSPIRLSAFRPALLLVPSAGLSGPSRGSRSQAAVGAPWGGLGWSGGREVDCVCGLGNNRVHRLNGKTSVWFGRGKRLR